MQQGFSPNLRPRDGLIPRSFDYILHRIHQLKSAVPGLDVTIKASYCEIYNEQVSFLQSLLSFVHVCTSFQVRDLLNPDPDPSMKLAVRLGRIGGSSRPEQHGFFVENQLMVECSIASLDDLMAVLTEGHKNRSIGAHALNRDSSRSHCILVIQFQVGMRVTFGFGRCLRIVLMFSLSRSIGS